MPKLLLFYLMLTAGANILVFLKFENVQGLEIFFCLATRYSTSQYLIYEKYIRQNSFKEHCFCKDALDAIIIPAFCVHIVCKSSCKVCCIFFGLAVRLL